MKRASWKFLKGISTVNGVESFRANIQRYLKKFKERNCIRFINVASCNNSHHPNVTLLR